MDSTACLQSEFSLKTSIQPSRDMSPLMSTPKQMTVGKRSPEIVPLTKTESQLGVLPKHRIENFLMISGTGSIIPLKCKDDKVRNFPQSLVNHFQFSTHPEYATDDITAVFNSGSDFYLEDDPMVNPQQIGFLELIVHEIVHVLGLMTSWKSLLNSNITTELVPRLNISLDIDQTKPVTYYGFVETIFDASLVTSEGDKFLKFTDQLNKFTLFETKFQTQQAFVNSFINSTQYNTTKKMLNYSQTPYSGIFSKSSFRTNMVGN
ncbi:19786_t:CDS:2 [Cetraspora pellucida]|uniref:19786_t:CDS:1 n=1 Tax=Cetraspora pellucida TaxID=1433469 RepID=A0A9N9HYE8_9GLOM|nr:19786_t:CDS:2 [Cetraspora pellucida]